MFKKILLHPVFLILFGVILGIFSKYGDTAYVKTLSSYFGQLSSGVLLWLVLCTLILLFADEKKKAIISILSLMLPMLISYYLFSYFVVKYLSLKAVIFWALMLVFSLLLTGVIWKIRFSNKFRWLFIIASSLSVIYDAFYVNGFEFFVMIPEIAFAVAVLLIINRLLKKQKAA